MTKTNRKRGLFSGGYYDQQIIEMHNSGMTAWEIARKLDADGTTIVRAMARLGIYHRIVASGHAVKARSDASLSNIQQQRLSMIGVRRRCPCCSTIFPIASADTMDEQRCPACVRDGRRAPGFEVSLCGCTAGMCAQEAA